MSTTPDPEPYRPAEGDLVRIGARGRVVWQVTNVWPDGSVDLRRERPASRTSTSTRYRGFGEARQWLKGRSWVGDVVKVEEPTR